jgi:hypothetical protein
MKFLRYALLLAVSTLGVGCACNKSSCCKSAATVSHSYGVMMEGSY